MRSQHSSGPGMMPWLYPMPSPDYPPEEGSAGGGASSEASNVGYSRDEDSRPASYAPPESAGAGAGAGAGTVAGDLAGDFVYHV